MRAAIALIAGATMLAGCGLRSDAPLLERSDRVAGLQSGQYRLYLPVEEADAGKIGAEWRDHCLSPARNVANAASGDPRRPVRLLYCDRDGTPDGVPQQFRLSADRDGYRLAAADQVSAVRLRALRGHFHLAQMQEADKPGYDYGVVDTGGDIALFMLRCEDFPRAQIQGNGGCAVTALDAILTALPPVLDRIESGDIPPLAILRRTGD